MVGCHMSGWGCSSRIGRRRGGRCCRRPARAAHARCLATTSEEYVAAARGYDVEIEQLRNVGFEPCAGSAVWGCNIFGRSRCDELRGVALARGARPDDDHGPTSHSSQRHRRTARATASPGYRHPTSERSFGFLRCSCNDTCVTARIVPAPSVSSRYLDARNG